MDNTNENLTNAAPLAPPAQPGPPMAGPLDRILGYSLELFPMVLLVLLPVLGGLLATAYLIFRDGIFPGQSIGKKILKTQVLIQQTGQPATLRESVIRNSPLAFNFFLSIIPVVGHFAGGITGTVVFLIEALAIFTDKEHRRLGDKMAGTIVVKRAA